MTKTVVKAEEVSRIWLYQGGPCATMICAARAEPRVAAAVSLVADGRPRGNKRQCVLYLSKCETGLLF